MGNIEIKDCCSNLAKIYKKYMKMNFILIAKIFFSMMVSNCTGERSFSKLKPIKNELRSTMLQERLNCLSIMSIESNVLLNIDFDD